MAKNPSFDRQARSLNNHNTKEVITLMKSYDE